MITDKKQAKSHGYKVWLVDAILAEPRYSRKTVQNDVERRNLEFRDLRPLTVMTDENSLIDRLLQASKEYGL